MEQGYECKTAPISFSPILSSTGRGYVPRIALAKGIPIHMARHSIATDTCYEKAELLGWDPERIVKAVYFSDGGKMVGVITPEFGAPIPVKELLRAGLGLSGSRAKRYRVSSQTPVGMEHGTCSPFPYEGSMEMEISDLVIVDHPSIDDTLVDISVGGTGEEAHKTSMHLPYGGIHTILRERFGDRIHLVG